MIEPVGMHLLLFLFYVVFGGCNIAMKYHIAIKQVRVVEVVTLRCDASVMASQTSGRRITQLAKITIDPKFFELTADVFVRII